MTPDRRAEIARRIHEAREDLGLTQGELAAQCRLLRSSVSRYENGNRVPSALTMRKLANALGKPIPYLRASDFESEGVTTNGASRDDS